MKNYGIILDNKDITNKHYVEEHGGGGGGSDHLLTITEPSEGNYVYSLDDEETTSFDTLYETVSRLTEAGSIHAVYTDLNLFYYTTDRISTAHLKGTGGTTLERSITIIFSSDLRLYRFTITSTNVGDGIVTVITKDDNKDNMEEFTDPTIPTNKGWGTIGSRYLDSSSNIGPNSVTFGTGCTASAENSQAMGSYSTASEMCAHAEGQATVASGDRSHAEGNNSRAEGGASHAEGFLTTASGIYSHAEGDETEAQGMASHTEGSYTKTQFPYEHAQGHFNLSNTDGTSNNYTIDSIGIGDDDSHRKNAVETWSNGKHYILGVGGYDGTNPMDTNVKDVAAYLADIHLYQHFFGIMRNATNDSLYFSFAILSSSATMTVAQMKTWFKDNGFTSSDYIYPAAGLAASSTIYVASTSGGSTNKEIVNTQLAQGIFYNPSDSKMYYFFRSNTEVVIDDDRLKELKHIKIF